MSNPNIFFWRSADANGLLDSHVVANAGSSKETDHLPKSSNAYHTIDFGEPFRAPVTDHLDDQYAEDLDADVKIVKVEPIFSSNKDQPPNLDLLLTQEQRTAVAQFGSNLKLLATLKQHMCDVISSINGVNRQDVLAMKDFALDLIPQVAIIPTGVSEEVASYATTLYNEAQYAVRRIERRLQALEAAPVAPSSSAVDSSTRGELQRATRKNQLLARLARLDEQYHEANDNLKLVQQVLHTRLGEFEQAKVAFNVFNDTVVKELGYDVNVLRAQRTNHSSPAPPAPQPPPRMPVEKSSEKGCTGSNPKAQSSRRVSTKVTQPCLFCEGYHFSFLCFNPMYNTRNKRLRFYTDNKLCQRCAVSHSALGRKNCFAPLKGCRWFHCRIEGDHHTNLCPNAVYPVTRVTAEGWVAAAKRRICVSSS